MLLSTTRRQGLNAKDFSPFVRDRIIVPIRDTASGHAPGCVKMMPNTLPNAPESNPGPPLKRFGATCVPSGRIMLINACSSFTRPDSFPGLVGEPIRRRLVARQNRKLPVIDDLLVLHDCHLAASRLVRSVTAMKRVLYVQPDGILRQICPAEGLAATSDHNDCAIPRDFIVAPHQFFVHEFFVHK